MTQILLVRTAVKKKVTPTSIPNEQQRKANEVPGTCYLGTWYQRTGYDQHSKRKTGDSRLE